MTNDKYLSLVDLIGVELASDLVLSIGNGAKHNQADLKSAWSCRYCGSMIGNESLKCPSCGGERR